MVPPSLAPMLRELNELGQLGLPRFLVQALATGAFSGLIIGLFRIAYTTVSSFLCVFVSAASFSTPLPIILLFCILFCASFLSYCLLLFEPLISGSGIPQVELMLAGKLPLMRWGRVLFAKFLGTLVSLSSGLSLGREGPCIQMGAAAGLGCGFLFRVTEQGGVGRFLVGGACAGMTAAFGAPLAGLLFAFEEMKMVLRLPLFLFCALASFSAFIVVHSCLGLGLVFPFLHTSPLALGQLWLLPLLGLLSDRKSVV